MATKIKILIGILVIILLIIGGWWTWNQLTCKGICYGNKIKSCRPIGFKCLCEEFLTCSKKCGAECETGEDCREGEICDVENCKCITGEVVDSFTDETKIASKENLIIDITSGEVKLRIAKTISVDAGKVHTCTVLSDGAVKCWGRNNDGQLGDGTNADKFNPISVPGITNAISVTASGGNHTCAVLSDGTIKCWGSDYYGELGNGASRVYKNSPVSVSGINNAFSIATGNGFTCAVLSDHTIKCWGRNVNGELGDGSFINKSRPVLVSGINDAVSVSAGIAHACALLSGGTIKCWGYNGFGQIGDGTNINRGTPVLVPGMNNVLSVSAGGHHTCAILANGTGKCWGNGGDGQLGDGFRSSKNSPVSVSGINNAVSISAGIYYTCTVLSDGAVKCWGRNNDGQLGDGTNEMRPLPVSVFGITDAISVSAESMHTCINSSVGTVKCWGYNAYGELGYGITADINKPVSVINLGILTSANLLSGRNVGSIDSFNYNSSFISPGCGLKVQFSQNNIDWYDSLGNINNWNNLSQGEHVINLSSLNWSGPDFYYRLKFESDFSCVPVLNEIIMKYHFPTY